MHTDRLTAMLAERILRWKVAPDRFLTGGRSWLPRWRFNPLQRLEDAFMLLDHHQSIRYVISQKNGKCRVEVEYEGKIGRASSDSKPRAIVLALARSIGVLAPAIQTEFNASR